MRSRVKEELFAVLTPEEQLRFDLNTAIERINYAVAKWVQQEGSNDNIISKQYDREKGENIV